MRLCEAHLIRAKAREDADTISVYEATLIRAKRLYDAHLIRAKAKEPSPAATVEDISPEVATLASLRAHLIRAQAEEPATVATYVHSDTSGSLGGFVRDTAHHQYPSVNLVGAALRLLSDLALTRIVLLDGAARLQAISAKGASSESDEVCRQTFHGNPVSAGTQCDGKDWPAVRWNRLIAALHDQLEIEMPSGRSYADGLRNVPPDSPTGMEIGRALVLASAFFATESEIIDRIDPHDTSTVAVKAAGAVRDASQAAWAFSQELLRIAETGDWADLFDAISEPPEDGWADLIDWLEEPPAEVALINAIDEPPVEVDWADLFEAAIRVDQDDAVVHAWILDSFRRISAKAGAEALDLKSGKAPSASGTLFRWPQEKQKKG